MNNLLAALIFFTRLPFYKVKVVPQTCYRHVVSFWSLTGWLTGGIMALVFLGAVRIMPVAPAIILALLSRVMITGGLHEDGLTDFVDGFGGGTDRESILRIMKDTHIGSYGLLALVFYFLIAYTLLDALPPDRIPYVLLCGDVCCKCVCSNIVCLLPYARPDEESKNRTVYQRPDWKYLLLNAFAGLPALLLWPAEKLHILLFPLISFILLIRTMKKKIDGYTGDCCGAAFLLCELSFWFGSLLLFS